MASRVLKTKIDLLQWCGFLGDQPLPCTVSVVAGAKRTNPQNRTINMWYAEIAGQLEDTDASEVRAMCKLELGVPILRRDDPAFAAAYDTMFKPLPYAHKLTLFRRLEPAVTSIMTVNQLREFMDQMQRRYAQAGIILTDPEARKYEGAA